MKNVAVITGASTGIGRELAHIHAEKGGDLVIVARSKDKLEALKKELETKHSIKVYVIAKDLGLPESPKEVYDEIKKVGIETEILINNAGFGGVGVFHELNYEQHMAMINLNITSLTAMTRLFLPDFVARNSGKILNTSSTASLMPGPLQAVYFATKAYVTSFSNALSAELADTNVTVTNLMPGATETEFGASSGMDKTAMFKKTASARKVAEAGYNAMLKGKIDVVSGLTTAQKIMISGIPFMPKKLLLKIVKSMQQPK
ncbi:SDR family NAD(P)-dependent oxidoreductase [Draconibacterium sediminis]|uniref:Short-chain dehydrogenase n=1 Tax=Draconibacterium sediminis TaxID=1544798 RepID=A0A0D8JAG5_9BACT|nr:SDR family oxidoreductase [Draconibacterium sediminis]KJF43995.1 short-chain dehydrogenase [Draconibacterium sediminis]